MTTTESTPGTGRGRTTAADRVPIPTRQRRPGRAALAVVLILGGAALSGYLAITSGNKQSVLALARDVADGNVITAADLTTISVSAPDVDAIPASQFDEVVAKRYRAQGKYPRGLILVTGMLRPFEVPGTGYVSVAVLVPEGAFPPQTINSGNAVKVLYTPKGGGLDQNGRPLIADLQPGRVLIDKAYVVNSKQTNAGGGVFVLVVANTNDPPTQTALSNLLLANSAQAITLILLPDSERAPTGEGQS
jgi:hypothetical protein